MNSDPQPSENSEHRRTLKALMPYLWPHGRPDLRLRVILAMLFLVAAKLVGVYVPFIMKAVVDHLTAPQILVAPVALIVAYGVLRMSSDLFGELRDSIFVRVGQNALRVIALQTFRHLHALSLRFHLERRTGGLSRAIERGIKGIDFLLRFTLFNILPTLFEIGLVTGILYVKFGFWFAAVTFGSIAFYITFTFSVTEWRLKYRREMNAQDTKANTKAVDSLLNYETVKYFGNEEHEARRYDEALAGYEKAAVRSQTTLSLLNVGQQGIVALGLVTVMIMAGYKVQAKELTVGDFVMINALVMQLYMPLDFLGFVYREIKQSLVDMEFMFRLLKSETEITDKPGAKPLVREGGAVTFEHVNFHYEPRRPILKDLSFHVAAGQTLAIVGPSGAGKSTISRILFRFYDIADGSVHIDGQDIRGVTQDSLRAAIGVVPQDTVLFNDTIGYNIRYGRPDATDAEVEAAARLAHIHEFVEGLPDGYQTMVGERGLKLSGGEKQRVAIARTILKNPCILLLDEATSALDTHTEREIQSSFKDVAAGRTTLIIAHRLSTVVDADQILVLEAGRVVERGRHEALLEADGVYAAMWRRQQEAAEAREKLVALDEVEASEEALAEG
ncbi:ABCB family ABC transporter ATP-binding protein/permease [Govanella unica]|uniref:ABC transporter ATP-binding protein/permease n=1 Tax=Govanella unica TaxID=2975056 RepID=A0A9X3Z6N2_9PROT|nr:ABC transporter ATP-binding protein/permease [Govania unica]MDA5193262.1 ABC transporter ATP-binding protein/permease [Govania unica]